MTNKINNLLIIVFYFLAILIVSLFFLSNSYSYSDVDLSWHLRIGQDILQNKQAPNLNYYNYTLFQEKWVDHEWFLNALMVILFNFINFIGLHLFFLFLLILIVFFTFKRNINLLGKQSIFQIGVFIWLFLGLLASRPHLGIRVQEFALLGLSILLWLFSLHKKENFRNYFWYLPLIFFFWANIHGSFILGLFLLVAYCFYIFISPFFKYLDHWQLFKIDNFNNKFKKQLLIITTLSFLATLINPYGLGLYSFLGTYTNTIYMSYIREWQSQFVFPLFYLQIFYLALAIVALFLLIKDRKINLLSWWDFFLFIFFFVLAFKSRRHFPLFVLVSLPFLNLAFQEFISSFVFLIKSYFSFNLKIFFIFLMFIIAIYQITNIPWLQHNINDFCGKKYPCAAVEYLKSKPELNNKRLFNHYDWGGYLLWSYPERQIFIDGRMPQAKYKNHTILEEYLRFRNNKEDINNLLNIYQIDLILLKKDSPFLKLRSWEKIFFNISEEELKKPDYLREYLDSSSDWQIIFEDNISIIYERKKD